MTDYKKEVFDDSPHYRLHYTWESHPHNSTPAHLHYDTSLVLTYFLKGTGSALVEGSLYSINPGDLLILNQSEIHVLTVDDCLHERISLYIQESIMEMFGCDSHHFFDIFYNRGNGTNNVISADVVRSLGIGDQFQKILEFSKRNTVEGSVLALCGIIELLDTLNQASEAPSGDMPVTPISNKHVNQIIKYLSENYTKKINIDELAGMFHFNKHYLCRLFKESTGTSIVEYCTYKRILAFNQLVCQNVPLESAAYQVGFHNYSNFYRLYRRHMGISPSEYKHQVAESG